MATVLILASDGMISGLLGQLTDLTGHAAQFRGEHEELSDAVYQSEPDVVLMDAAFGTAAMDRVALAGTEMCAPVVYFSPELSQAELRRLALERRSKYFPLPAGPSLLARIFSAALAERRMRVSADTVSIAQHAVSAALVAVARARMFVDRSSSTRMESRLLRSERENAVATCRRSYAALREAVIAYTRELRSVGVPPDRTLETVRRTLRGEIEGSPPLSATDSDREIGADAVEWCLQAYYAA